MYYISNILKERDPLSCISFILFKNFDNSQKEKIDNVAQNINKPKETDISVPNDINKLIDGYI